MKKVLLRSPILTQSGYGHHGRTVFRALLSRTDMFDVYLQPINWGNTSWLCENTPERALIDQIIKKTVAYMHGGGQFDMSLQVTIPNEWERIAPVNIGITAGIEATQISPKWIEKSNIMDRIITISEFAKSGFENTVYQAQNKQTGQPFEYKVFKPVSHIGYPVQEFEVEKVKLNLTTKFNFLTVAQMGPRKNLASTIKTFIETFRDNEDIGLIIKTNMAKNSKLDRVNTLNKLKNAVNSLGEKKCKIYLLHGKLSDNEMAGLYKNPKVKALVSATHGEGFGLPLFEAAYYGLPVIATDWSGHLDFLYMPQKQKNGKEKMKHMFGKVSYNLAPIQQEAVWQDVLIPEAHWAYPDLNSLKENMLDMHKDHGRFKKRAKQLQSWIKENFTEEKIYKQYVDEIIGFDSSMFYAPEKDETEQNEVVLEFE